MTSRYHYSLFLIILSIFVVTGANAQTPMAFEQIETLIKRLVIQPSFQFEKLQGQYCELPSWVARLKGLTYLKLNQVIVDQLNILEDTEIKFLEFNNIQFRNGPGSTIIEDIKKLKHLKGIAYDNSIPLDIVHSLRMNCVNCELYLTTDEHQKQKFMHDLDIDL